MTTSTRIPFATTRYIASHGMLLSEYAYDLAADAVVEQRVRVPSVPMGITVGNIPNSYVADARITRFETDGYRFEKVDPSLFASNVAHFKPDPEKLRPDTQVWCYSMTPLDKTDWKLLMAKDEVAKDEVAEIFKSVTECFIMWLLDQPDSKQVVSTMHISWAYCLQPRVGSEEIYSRYLATLGTGMEMGLGTPVQREQGSSKGKIVPLSAWARAGKVSNEVPVDFCLPFILLDEDPNTKDLVSLSYVSADGTVTPEGERVHGDRTATVGHAAEAAFKTWGEQAPLVIWRRFRHPDAHAREVPTYRHMKPYTVVVVDWVVPDIFPARSIAAIRELVRAGMALMQETRAPMQDCMHHVLNMRLKMDKEGRGVRLVDSWSTQCLLKVGVPYVPWIMYGSNEDEEGAKKKSGAKPGKRKATHSPVALGPSEDTCDGFEPSASKMRLVRAAVTTTGSAEITRDAVYGNSSEPVSPTEDPADPMEVDEDDKGDGGDIAPITPGIFWPSEETQKGLYELDFRSYYPSLHIQYNLCPSRAATGDSTRLPIPAALVDVVQRRLRAKEAGNKPLDAALKSLLVCIYGVPGSRYSCYYSPEMRSEAARRGRENIRGLRKVLMEQYGATVLQSITDSVVCLIHAEALQKFQLTSDYYAPVQATDKGWIRLAEPVPIKAYWAINKNSRVWLKVGQDEVTMETCKGVYPNFTFAQPVGIAAFLCVADALMDPTKTAEELSTIFRAQLRSCPGSVIQALLRHFGKFCRVSIQQRWPTFLLDIEPVAKAHALDKELARGLPQLVPEPDLFPVVERFTLLRIGRYLDGVMSC